MTNENNKKYSGFIPSINCVNCKGKIIKATSDLVDEIDVNVSTKQITYITDNNQAVIERLQSINYPIETESLDRNYEQLKLIIGLIGSMYFIGKMILVHFFNIDFVILNSTFLDFIVATIVQIVIGRKYLLSALNDIKYKTYGMNLLVALSTMIAYVYSIYLMFTESQEMLFFEIQVVLITTIFVGQYIEEQIKNKANKEVKELIAFDSKQFLVKKNSEYILKDLEFIKVNEIIRIKAGEKIPLDGKIIYGQTKVNESLLTGEEKLVSKQTGEQVISGSINQENMIEVQVEKDYQNSYLNTLISQISDVTKSKPKIQKIGDKIIKIFVPLIIILSIVTFIYWYQLTGDFGTAVYVGLSTLIIACPCALGLATPISFMIGNRKFNQKQLLVRSMDSLLASHQIDTIAFDKTGTLIDKNVISVIKYTEEFNDNVMGLIKSIEKSSNHPLALMISDYLSDYTEEKLIGDVKENKGIGLEYLDYKIGSYKYLNDIDQKRCQNIANIFVVKNNKMILEFVLDFRVRREAKATLIELNKKFDTVMITGDQHQNAYEVGENLKFNKIYAEVLPNEKIEIIKSLQKQNKKVMYVGDGINDTLALAQADISVAINSDIDAVKQISDVVIINNNLSRINEIFKISEKVRKNVYQNYLWAFSYNVIAIPLAMSGMLNPMIAGIMMMMSSILVITNANRLLKLK